MKLYIKDCIATGYDPKVVRKLGKRLAAVASEINDLGLEIFGAEGSGLYIITPHCDNPLGKEPHVLVDTEECGNGGILQCREMSDGTHSLCG